MTAAATVPAAGTANLEYFGGPVVSSAQVVQVLYGTGTYLPEVTSTAAGQANVSHFLQHLMTSGYVTALSEYDTNVTAAGGRPGTNQRIVAGSFQGHVAITPAPARNGAVIYDDEVQAELQAQIDARVLPSPTVDVTGAARTVFTVFFRNGQRICDRTSGACSLQTGGFCAYHSSFRLHGNGAVVLYTVEPDLIGFSGRGCGSVGDFGITTASLSHELAEVITDPYVGFAADFAPPLAWYDRVLGENADICEQNYAPLVLSGQTYQVQQTWSNAAGACVTNSVPPRPGELQLQPAELVVLAGSSASTTVRLVGAGPATLSVTGLPAGVTATLAPTTLPEEGTTAQLTVTAADTAAVGPATVTVRTTTPAAFTTTLALTVVTPNGSAASALDPGTPIARLADTRSAAAVGPGAVLKVHTTAPGATAVVLDVVATEATAAGYVTVWPCAEPRPLASSLNTAPQRTVANLVTVAVGADGDVCLYNSAGSAHLVVDQFGAYTPTGDTARAGRFVPVRPVRALDTRTAGAAFGANETRTLDLATAAGIPAEAQAVALTITAVDAPANGYWATWASGPWPGTSNLNASAGQTVANQAIVPVALGKVQLRSLAGGHVVVDVAGWFTGTTAPEGRTGLFHAMTPVRALDTRRDGPHVVASLATILPGTATAVSLNVTVTAPVAPGFLTVYPADAARPVASNVNFGTGETVPGHVAVGLDVARVGLFTNVGADLVVDVAGWYA